jgi:hypothetical protein
MERLAQTIKDLLSDAPEGVHGFHVYMALRPDLGPGAPHVNIDGPESLNFVLECGGTPMRKMEIVNGKWALTDEEGWRLFGCQWSRTIEAVVDGVVFRAREYRDVEQPKEPA